MKLPYRSRHPNPGILTFELLPNAIILEFRSSPHRYLYTADTPGPIHVAAMRRLAQAGTGLTTYVNQHVREHYAARLPR